MLDLVTEMEKFLQKFRALISRALADVTSYSVLGRGEFFLKLIKFALEPTHIG